MNLTQERLDELVAAQEVAWLAVREARRLFVNAEYQHHAAQLELLNYRRRMEIAERTRQGVEAEQRRARA